jgi:hypothetical protein
MVNVGAGWEMWTMDGKCGHCMGNVDTGWEMWTLDGKCGHDYDSKKNCKLRKRIDGEELQ